MVGSSPPGGLKKPGHETNTLFGKLKPECGVIVVGIFNQQR